MKCSLIVIFLFAALLSTPANAAVPQPAAIGTNRELVQNELARLELILRSSSFPEVEKAVNEAWSRCRLESDLVCAEMTFQLCKLLHEGPRHDWSDHLADKTAFKSLTELKNITVEQRLLLSFNLEVPPLGMPPDEFKKMRDQRATLSLRIWNEILKSIDPMFNPKVLPVINVQPPRALVGQQPDAQAMAAYQATVAKNNAYAQYYGMQHSLRRLISNYQDLWKKRMILLFAAGPEDSKGFTALLQELLDDQALRNELIKSVTTTRNLDRTAATQPGKN